MIDNILDKIIIKKKERLEKLKKQLSIEVLQEKVKENNFFINFKEKIQKNITKDKISLIAEIKKASPSAGIIIKNYDPVNLANKFFQNKATCLSVLTEEDFFYGNLIHLYKVKKKNKFTCLMQRFFYRSFSNSFS